MKISGPLNKANEDIKLNMTAMIDVVFQLLVFFIMTFKIVAAEGDFNVRMPLASEVPPEQVLEDVPTLIRVKLNAGDDGRIASIDVDDGLESQSFTEPDMFQQLTRFVEKALAGNLDPESSPQTEVEFDIDYQLKYRFTVQAIGAVSGRVTEEGEVKKLIEKIKFRDNSRN